MTQTNELRIENELEALVNEAKIMKRKEMQIQKFIENKDDSILILEDSKYMERRREEGVEIDTMLEELEKEKEENPEILEFYYMFEEMKLFFEESVKKEHKLGLTYKELVTGKTHKKKSSWRTKSKTT